MKNALAILMLVALVPSQSVQAQTAPVETAPVVETVSTDEAKAPTVQDVLLDVCTVRGYGETCAKHLLGMVWNETGNVYNAIGDHGKARGYFQIWTKLRTVTGACAEDRVCSANWTLTYMERWRGCLYRSQGFRDGPRHRQVMKTPPLTGRRLRLGFGRRGRSGRSPLGEQAPSEGANDRGDEDPPGAAGAGPCRFIGFLRRLLDGRLGRADQ